MFILGLPVFPERVVTMMTPLAPFAPNTAVAEASFSTEIVATSFGSRSEKLRSMPSTSTRGSEPVPARYAAHVELHVVVAGLAARLNARDARKFAGDGLRDVGRSRIDQFVGADLGDGAQDALLLLDAVAYDDDIIDLLSLFDKRYGQGFPPPIALISRDS